MNKKLMIVSALIPNGQFCEGVDGECEFLEIKYGYPRCALFGGRLEDDGLYAKKTPVCFASQKHATDIINALKMVIEDARDWRPISQEVISACSSALEKLTDAGE